MQALIWVGAVLAVLGLGGNLASVSTGFLGLAVVAAGVILS